jgi:hypothetical protein
VRPRRTRPAPRTTHIAAKAKARQLATLKQGDQRPVPLKSGEQGHGHGGTDPVPSISTEQENPHLKSGEGPKARETRTQLAKLAGMSPATVAMSKHLEPLIAAQAKANERAVTKNRVY